MSDQATGNLTGEEVAMLQRALIRTGKKIEKPAQPDCRTCENLESCKEDARWMRNYCTNGDRYVEAPKVVLWRTEP